MGTDARTHDAHQSVAARGTGLTVAFLAVCAVGLIPWTIVLAVTLPACYLVGSWTLTWTGFDIVLLVCFTGTAWALRARRPIALPAAVFTSALLLSDSWFDVSTAHGGHDLLVSVASALFGEIPAATVLAALSMKLLRANAVTDLPALPIRVLPSRVLPIRGVHHAHHPTPRPEPPTAGTRPGVIAFGERGPSRPGFASREHRHGQGRRPTAAHLGGAGAHPSHPKRGRRR